MSDWAIKILLVILAILTMGFVFIVWFPHGPDKNALIANALVNSPTPREFERLFPDCEHSIDYMKHRFPSGEYRFVDNW